MARPLECGCEDCINKWECVQHWWQDVARQLDRRYDTIDRMLASGSTYSYLVSAAAHQARYCDCTRNPGYALCKGLDEPVVWQLYEMWKDSADDVLWDFLGALSMVADVVSTDRELPESTRRRALHDLVAGVRLADVVLSHWERAVELMERLAKGDCSALVQLVQLSPLLCNLTSAMWRVKRTLQKRYWRWCVKCGDCEA